jgi:ferritin-like protein
MASDGFHEPVELLSPRTKDMHRAISTLMEELEAIDWYQQRAEGCADDELRAIILHNKNEEIEHAMMTLEWLRRKDPDFGSRIETYVFSEGPITAVEAAAKGGDSAPSAEGPPAAGSSAEAAAPAVSPSLESAAGLGIGSLKERL